MCGWGGGRGVDSGGVYKLVRHHEKTIEKSWQFKYNPRMVLLGRARALNSLQVPPIRIRAVCQPCMELEGLAALAVLIQVIV